MLFALLLFALSLLALLLFALSLFALFLKIAHIKEPLWVLCSHRSFKKSDMSKLLLLFTKKHPWVNCSCCSLQKSDISDLLVIQGNRSKKWVIFCMFLTVFHISPPPFLCPRANSSCHPSLKSNREQFSPVPHYKRAIEPIRSFS